MLVWTSLSETKEKLRQKQKDSKWIPTNVTHSRQICFRLQSFQSPKSAVCRDDEDMDIPAGSQERPASAPLVGDVAKIQNMDEDPVRVPKSNAAGTDRDVHQVTRLKFVTLTNLIL